MFRLLQSLFASMSLERKCLLFFGSALSILMCGAFFVVQILGKRLVKNTTEDATDNPLPRRAPAPAHGSRPSPSPSPSPVRISRPRWAAARG